ncbi:MAG: hypothetical protein Q9218_000281 [Villophora microphyllina]
MADPSNSLSKNDTEVLTRLFDPDSAHSSTCLVDPTHPPLPDIPYSLFIELQSLERAAISPLDTPSPSTESIHQAIKTLTSLIEVHPTYPSAYNNRAQATRLLVGDDLTTLPAAQSTLLSDLQTAIRYASPSPSEKAISRFQQLILSSAHTHLAHLLYRLSQSKSWPLPISTPNREAILAALPEGIRRKSKAELEEWALGEFEMGRRYGNEVAGEMARRMNPYARLCGGIVSEALGRETKGYEGSK